MRAEIQEWLAFAVVGGVTTVSLVRLFLRYGAGPASVWLLKHGRVKWAMWLRRSGR